MGWWCLGAAHQNEDKSYPSYWNCSEGLADDRFVELHAADVGRERVQELIDGTFCQRFTRDRRSTMPSSLQVVAVLRMENATLWRKYAAKRDKIRKARGHRVGSWRSGAQSSLGQEQTPPPKTAGSLHLLDEDVQESYLFHGTHAKAALQIQRRGFELNHARRGLFGAGIYFAESASKADEYAGNTEDNLHVMLLSRVVRGVVYRVEKPDSCLHIKSKIKRKYDSVLGDREAAVGTYREYIVYDEAQAYPEYAVIYRRTFCRSPPVPPVLVSMNSKLCIMAAVRARAGESHKVTPVTFLAVPEYFREYLSAAEVLEYTTREISSAGNGVPDVLFADTTGDGEFNQQMMAVGNEDYDGVVRRMWVPIPNNLEFPLAALCGDLKKVQALVKSISNLEEPLLHGMTALSLAHAHGQSEVIQFLQETYKARQLAYKARQVAKNAANWRIMSEWA